MITIEKERKQNILKRLKSDPIYHIEKIQGVSTLEPYQKSIIRAVAANERTVISACHDIGKTWTMAKVVLWFCSTHKGAKVITTAPTFNQVKRLLWSEIRTGYSQSRVPLGGEMLVTEWKIDADWFALGFTSRNEAASGEGQGNASSFQGFHAQSILVVFDEATGVPSTIWKQMEGILTSGHVRFVAIGNPTSRSCEFYRCFSDPVYYKIKLSCFDSPNFHANKMYSMKEFLPEYDRLRELTEDEQRKALASYLVPNIHFVTLSWVMQMCLRNGLDHPLVASKCFGNFPDEDNHGLISLSTIELAQHRTCEPTISDRVSIGVDVARFGTDKTSFTVIHGKRVVARKNLMKRDTNEITGELVRIIHEKTAQGIHDIVLCIDATGVGSGVVDSLREKRDENSIPAFVNIREVHFGAAPGPKDDTEAKSYVNLKARIFCQLNEDLKNELELLDDDIYAEELPTIHYRFDSRGRYVIESKEEYKKRTGRGSPDDSDSLALANYGRYDAFGVGEFTEALVNEELLENAGLTATGGLDW